MKIFSYIIIVIVVVAIVAGFITIGSPGEERLRRFDEGRVQDLQYLQSQIIFFWQSKNRLPENSGELADELRGVRIPQDPQSDQDYIYEAKDRLNFSLCADFSRESFISEGVQPRQMVPIFPDGTVVKTAFVSPETWEHKAGHFCFERTIDPDFFKTK